MYSGYFLSSVGTLNGVLKIPYSYVIVGCGAADFAFGLELGFQLGFLGCVAGFGVCISRSAAVFFCYCFHMLECSCFDWWLGSFGLFGASLSSGGEAGVCVRCFSQVYVGLNFGLRVVWVFRIFAAPFLYCSFFTRECLMRLAFCSSRINLLFKKTVTDNSDLSMYLEDCFSF